MSVRRKPEGLGYGVVAIALLTLLVVLVLPLAVVASRALADGAAAYAEAVTDEGTLSALRLTLLVVAIVVPTHAVFGVAIAWALARGRFAGRTLLSVLVDVPLALSPIVSGVLFVLLFGARGILGPFLAAHGMRIVFAVPGVVLVTLFVTLPFVARELVPMLEADGLDEDEAAASLGANGFALLTRVVLPRIRWGLFYGCVLAASRAAGEFGAVSVVSGHVRGETATLPLQVEALYHEYDTTGAFGAASILAAVAIVTLTLKAWLERRVALARAEVTS
jgi:sulfate transport system permease protein